MAIRIIDDQPDVVLTRAEHDRLQQEYQQNMMFMVNPPSFEEWVRSRREDQQHGRPSSRPVTWVPGQPNHVGDAPGWWLQGPIANAAAAPHKGESQ